MFFIVSQWFENEYQNEARPSNIEDRAQRVEYPRRLHPGARILSARISLSCLGASSGGHSYRNRNSLIRPVRVHSEIMSVEECIIWAFSFLRYNVYFYHDLEFDTCPKAVIDIARQYYSRVDLLSARERDEHDLNNPETRVAFVYYILVNASRSRIPTNSPLYSQWPNNILPPDGLLLSETNPQKMFRYQWNRRFWFQWDQNTLSWHLHFTSWIKIVCSRLEEAPRCHCPPPALVGRRRRFCLNCNYLF